MNHIVKFLGIGSVVTSGALVLAACSGGSDNLSTPPAVINSVPDSAGVSSASFVAYLLSLNQNDESSEPLLISDNFAVPPDETDNVLPIF